MTSPRSPRFHGRVPREAPCAVPGCQEPGEFRAPASPHRSPDGPPPYRWLCLDHVREFNAGYNYFEGMNADQDGQHAHFPDYTIRLDEKQDQVTFTPRMARAALPPSTQIPIISEAALEKARKVAPGYDVYALKSDYLTFWDEKGRQELKNPDAAFLGWCKKRHERNPLR